MIYQRVVERLD